MNWLKLVLTYLPVVLQGVTAVESAIKAPGKTKKQIVLDAIQAGAQTGQQIPEEHVQGISTLVDTVVGTLNASGVFSHAQPGQ